MIGDFELTNEHIQRLLAQLKKDHINTKEDLQKYLRNYNYMNDPSRKCHLLISPSPKRENFAIPYDE